MKCQTEQNYASTPKYLKYQSMYYVALLMVHKPALACFLLPPCIQLSDCFLLPSLCCVKQ